MLQVRVVEQVGEPAGRLQVLSVAVGSEPLVALRPVPGVDGVTFVLGERGPVAGHAVTLALPWTSEAGGPGGG